MRKKEKQNKIGLKEEEDFASHYRIEASRKMQLESESRVFKITCL